VPSMTYSDRAKRIHADLPVCDGHNDLPWRLREIADGDLDVMDPSGPLPGVHTDIPRLLEGGVGAQWWSVYVPGDEAHPFEAANRQIDLVEAMVARDDRLAPARTADDVLRIRSEGRIASLIGAEGGHAIEGSLDNLGRLADRGVGYMTLTHVDTLPWADSATGGAVHGGLTAFGRDVVREMNRLGMLVDISHVSPDTMRDALAASAAPLIASHSNAHAIAPHPRNIPDDVLAEVGARGGVVMVSFFPGFVLREAAATAVRMFDAWRSLRHELDAQTVATRMRELEAGIERGTVADVVDHIEHIARVAGVDAVGLGSDFDGMTITPSGLDDVSCYPAITDELISRQWSDRDIGKILGGNSVRVLEAVQAAAG
jgi:membrane dipeptidase